ncbi:hypothetical protein GCM10025867_48720 (plasmid) [Frondihabitans sucicola]|uniref:Uncharacterized protein n=1 Tax=Frondihabitans sucicola TaxID=1268041 RepID=A0ABN6Y642_9MICO|nr:hypothetical protein [Frondihabitans sucicola]BDZ52631.1 hypothetical protein GCM10025867_48720 [Frondihabitans sucicola]
MSTSTAVTGSPTGTDAPSKSNVLPFPVRPSLHRPAEPEYVVEREAEYSVEQLANEPAIEAADAKDVAEITAPRIARTRLVITDRGVMVLTVIGTIVGATVISKAAWFLYFLHFGG